MGLALEQPPVGCCGLAGSFGYETEHFPVSTQIAEQVLLPAVRQADDDTLIISDGFSCRQQIRDGAGRWPLHPAEVIAAALRQASGRAAEFHPGAPPEPATIETRGLVLTAGIALAGAIAASLLLHRRRGL